MAMKILSNNEISTLLTAIAHHSNQYLEEIESDLMQISFLLNEAIEKLSPSFIGIHSAVVAHQLAMIELISQHEFSNEAAKKLDIFKAMIADEVNTAVTGLQFQDLTSQLLNRSIKHVLGIKDLLATLAKPEEGIDVAINNDDHQPNEINKMFSKVEPQLNISSNTPSSGMHKSINQRDMGSGDIILF